MDLEEDGCKSFSKYSICIFWFMSKSNMDNIAAFQAFFSSLAEFSENWKINTNHSNLKLIQGCRYWEILANYENGLLVVTNGFVAEKYRVGYFGIQA